MCCQLCIKVKRYRYFTSASTFFQCDIMNVVNYLKYSVYCKFTVYALLDLLLNMSMIDHCLFCSHIDLEIKLI